MYRFLRCTFGLLLLAGLCVGCGETVIPIRAAGNWISSFRLVDQSANLRVRQGYASGTSSSGSALNFFFDTQALYSSSSYDTLQTVASNRNFLLPGTTHLGAGDYADGHVYGVIEHWQSCSKSAAPIFIIIFDASTLAVERAVEITTVIPEASGIAIEGKTGEAIVSSFCDSKNLYAFSTEDWSFVRKIPLAIPVSGIQGVSYRDDFVYIAGTNGGLYALYLRDGSMRLLLQSPVSGEFEGVDFHGEQLRWLVNRSDGQSVLYSYAPVYASLPGS